MAFRSYENNDLAALKDLIWIKDILEYQLNIRFDRSLMWKREIARFTLLSFTIIAFGYLKPKGSNKVIIFTHAHLRELVLDIILFAL